MSEPRLIGERYELGSLLGYGGMAEVHLGRDVRLGRQVAIKILRPDLARDPSFQNRFRREAQAAGGLNHPNIVSVYDTGEDRTPDGDVPYIVMEYVDGRTLRDVLSMEGRLEANRAMEIVAEVCAALDFSHRHGIVHRDIKPANVMITRAGTAKVMDFGIARAVADGSATVTQTAAVIGTAQYLSPEQARGETVDARSDVYSTGCLLYELVTGHPPFQGDSPVAVAYQHVRESAPPPSSIVPSVPRPLDSIVMKALAKNALNRYQTAGEMRADLLQAIADRPVAAEPVMSEDERTQMIASMAPAAADRPRRPDLVALEEGEDGNPSRRGALLWTAAIVVLLLVIGVGAWLIFKPAKKQTAAPPPQITVPNLVGLSPPDAMARIAASKLKLADQQKSTNDNSQCTTAKPSTVCSQTPLPNEQVNQNTTVTLTIYAGPQMVQVPYVVDQQLAAAQAAITQAGLIPVPVSRASNQARGTVISQSPVNVAVAKGQKITLYYSSGQLKIPDVTGQSDTAARQILNRAGFQKIAAKDGVDPNTVTANAGKVSRTDPAEGSVVDADSTITIYVLQTPVVTCTTRSTPTGPSSGSTTGSSTGTTGSTSASPPTGSTSSSSPSGTTSTTPAC